MEAGGLLCVQNQGWPQNKTLTREEGNGGKSQRAERTAEETAATSSSL